jgi:N-methylhydantoinase B/oxoprolinase/acetone carboxylase alpha subunit
MSIEAMKQALDALEKSVATCFHEYAHEQVMSFPEHFINQTITALRTAIEQAEKQGPCIAVSSDRITIDARNGNLSIGAPRQWVGVTAEEVHEAFCHVEYETPNDWNTDPDDWCQQFARYIEAKLKEKNNVL